VNALPESTKAYFIKLGVGGEWEPECLAEGTIKFGYRETPNELGLNGEWDNKVKEFWAGKRNKEGTATSDMRQIRTFFEASEDDLFITFAKGYLWWCQPTGTPVVLIEEGGARVRQTVDGWKNTSIGGEPLLMSLLSGKLTKARCIKAPFATSKNRRICCAGSTISKLRSWSKLRPRNKCWSNKSWPWFGCSRRKTSSSWWS
jgi:hypothetical protein